MPLVRCKECERALPADLVTDDLCKRCRETYQKRYIRPVPDEPIKYSPEYRRFVAQTLLQIRNGF